MYIYIRTRKLSPGSHTHTLTHTHLRAQLQMYVYPGHIYASISCIHMLVCQLHIPGLWMHAKATAILAIEAHGTAHRCVGACVVVDMYRDS